jgi:uncharacterized membrane protein
MPALIAAGLIAASLFALVINLYFISLMVPFPARLKALLGWTAHACGVEGGVCEIVVQTPYARMFGGVPNVFVGVFWNFWIVFVATQLAFTHVLPFAVFTRVIAVASLGVAAYLIYVLLFVLKKPCPL